MNKINILLSFILIAFLFSSCKEETGCTDANAINFSADAAEDDGTCSYPSVSLDLHHKVGSEHLSLGSEYTINGTKVRIDRLQYYLAELNVTGDAATEFTDKILLIDAATVNYDLGTSIVGHAHMLRFSVGVPSGLNTGTDPATYEEDNPLYPQIPSMDWGWQNGYKFLVLEGQVDSDGDDVVDSTLEIHLGKDEYYTPVMTEIHNDITSASHIIHMEVDIAKLFTDIEDLASNSVTHVADNIGLADELKSNLPSIFSHE